MSTTRKFCCLIFISFFISQAVAQLDYGTAHIGQGCERDYHCIKNAFCRSQMTCLCEPNYLPVPDASACIPTVGLFCDTDAVCALMSNGECRQNVCACKETFTVDITNSSNCLATPVAVNDRCQRNDECIANLDRALCINGRCECLTNHHYALGIGKCVRSAGILEACDHDYRCYMPDLGAEADKLQCREGLCRCTDGMTSRHCNGGSINSATMMTAIFFFALAIFLT